MARSPQPWFRQDRQAWFVTINGQRHNLGPDEQEAKRKFHELMASKPKCPIATHTYLTVADIFEKFLAWTSIHRAPKTYQWNQFRIQMFVDALGAGVSMPVSSLKPFHVVEWSDKHPDWSPNYRHGLIQAVQRAFNWAVKLGHLDTNPIRHIEKPGLSRREELITSIDWEKVRDHYAEGDPFRDLLEFSWESGARPFEARRIETRHVQLEQHRVYFPKEESKGKKRPRIIYMTVRAEQIIKRLMVDRAGLLFLNARNKPWTPFCINNRFCRLQKHVGKKMCQMLLRHSFATTKLEEGTAPATVAALLGHADLSMISRFYGHLDKSSDHLQQAVGQ